MPHLTMEYSVNLADRETMTRLLGDLHSIVGSTEWVDIETVKSRMIAHETYFIGQDSSKRAFLHVECLILPGRTEAMVREMGERIHHKMLNTVHHLLPPNLKPSITLEIRELNLAHFFRTPPPSTV